MGIDISPPSQESDLLSRWDQLIQPPDSTSLGPNLVPPVERPKSTKHSTLQITEDFWAGPVVDAESISTLEDSDMAPRIPDDDHNFFMSLGRKKPSWEVEREERIKKILDHDFTPKHPKDRAIYERLRREKDPNRVRETDRLTEPLDHKRLKQYTREEMFGYYKNNGAEGVGFIDHLKCKILGHLMTDNADHLETARKYDIEKKLIVEYFGEDCKVEPECKGDQILWKYVCRRCFKAVDEITAHEMKMRKKYGKIKGLAVGSEGKSNGTTPDGGI